MVLSCARARAGWPQAIICGAVGRKSVYTAHHQHAVQDREGYKEQLVALRDKISVLARQVAEGEDGARSQGERLASLAAELEAAQAARREAERAWRNERILLEQVRATCAEGNRDLPVSRKVA